MMPVRSDRLYASPSSAETAAQGLSSTCAIPLTAATPMRRPVKEPGPTEAANKSTCWMVMWLQDSSDSTIGMMVWLWVRWASV